MKLYHRDKDAVVRLRYIEKNAPDTRNHRKMHCFIIFNTLVRTMHFVVGFYFR